VNSTKFIVALVGLVVTLWVTLAGKMDGDVTMALAIIVGGYFGANGFITGKALTSKTTVVTK
jgi:predicted membrane-bound spermidine synthase